MDLFITFPAKKMISATSMAENQAFRIAGRSAEDRGEHHAVEEGKQVRQQPMATHGKSSSHLCETNCKMMLGYCWIVLFQMCILYLYYAPKRLSFDVMYDFVKNVFAYMTLFLD